MEEQERKKFRPRIWGLTAVVSFVFLILGANLWKLQMVSGTYYQEKAQGNFMHIVPVRPMRGDVIDARGKVLATSVPQFDVTLDWLELQKANKDGWKDVVARLAHFVKPYWSIKSETEALIKEDILFMIQNQQWERYRPVSILSDVPQKLQAVIAEHADELPGVSIEAMPVRSYPQQTLAGQILGYVREIDESEIDQFNQDPVAKEKGMTYASGDLVGKMGIEKSYDAWLRGEEGSQQIIVDNLGRPIAKQVLSDPVPGKTIQLTIDANLQQAVEQELERIIQETKKKNPKAEAGAAVVIDVNTGKILAMASRPFMNPNELIGKISDEVSAKYFTGSDAATFNRSLSGLYPPGSTFKMLTAMTALEAGVVTPKESIISSMASLGPASIQAQGFPEWTGSPMVGRSVNLRQALAWSSDIYFEIMGKRAFDSQPELLRKLASEFGLGPISGIDIPGETKGISPSPSWKRDYFKPYYDKKYQQALDAIDKKYAEALTQAQDDKTKKHIQGQVDAEKNLAKFNYQQDLTYHVEWRPFDSFNNAIGQGYNSYSILQLANYVATTVNGGRHYRPYLVDKIIDPVSKKVIKEMKPDVLNTVSASPETLAAVKDGMRAVMTEGTAGNLFANVPEFSGGGKTGTAQTQSKTAASIGYNGMFVAFAPYDKPQIAVAGVVSDAEHGGSSAGYVAKAAIMKYFGWQEKP